MTHLKILHEMTSQCAKVTPQCRQRRSIFTAEFRGLSVLISSLNELVTDLINYTFPCPGMPKCLHRDGAFFLFFFLRSLAKKNNKLPLRSALEDRQNTAAESERCCCCCCLLEDHVVVGVVERVSSHNPHQSRVHQSLVRRPTQRLS